MLHPAVIERFICGTRAFSPASRRTLRTNLRSCARVEAHPPAPGALPRERAKPP